MKRCLFRTGILQLLVCCLLAACTLNEKKTESAQPVAVSKMEAVRFIEIPDCKMVSSGRISLGGKEFSNFMNWFSSLPQSIYPQDFLYNEGNSFVWLWVFTEGMNVPAEYDIIDFKGGTYAVSCGVDRGIIKTIDYAAMNVEKKKYLANLGYEVDESRPELRQILSDDLGPKILSYPQMDYWTPIKPISN